MLTFPNAKINLGLNITEKRPDGYHNLETIFYPIPVEDALEINPLREVTANIAASGWYGNSGRSGKQPRGEGV